MSQAHPTSRVHIFDRDGSRTQLSAGEWSDSVLPARFAETWDEPDRLRTLVELAVEDDLDLTALPAAYRLAQLLPTSDRDACLLAGILLRTHDSDGAERVLEEQVSMFGESAETLEALAELRRSRGEQGAALQFLRQALALDPNNKSALARWTELHHDRDPDGDAVEACLVEVAGEPGAWRPQLRLGELAVARGEDAIAMDCFRSAIARSGARQEVVHAVTFALADAGWIQDLVELAREIDTFEAPATEPGPGPEVMRILERLKKGRAIVDDLLERELPLLAHHFGEIETALDAEEEIEQDAEGQLVLEFGGRPQRGPRASNGAAMEPAVEGPSSGSDGEPDPVGVREVPSPRPLPVLTLLGPSPPDPDLASGLRAFSYRGPLWGRLLREGLSLLPAKGRTSRRVTFFAASDDAHANTDQITRQADPAGERQVAMLPLLLTEIISLTTDARADCTLPYRDRNGLLRRASRYGFAEMQSACEAEQPDTIVGCHTSRDLSGSWVELTIWDASAGAQLAQLRHPIEGGLEGTMLELADELVATLENVAGIQGLDGDRPLPMPEPIDDGFVDALADLLDLALIEVGIEPRKESDALQRCQRLLAHAHGHPGEALPRIMAVAGFVAAEETGDVPPASLDEIRELVQREDLEGRSLASLLPELRQRLAPR